MSVCSLIFPQHLQEGKHYILSLVLSLASGPSPQLHIGIAWRALKSADASVLPSRDSDIIDLGLGLGTRIFKSFLGESSG